MQNRTKNLAIYLSAIFTLLLGVHAATVQRPTLHARHQPPTPRPALVTHLQLVADSLLRLHEGIGEELSYYLHSHRIDDEGYGMIADYNTRNDSIIAYCQQQKILSHFAPAACLRSRQQSNTTSAYPIIAHRGYWDARGWHPGMPPFRHGMITDSLGVYRGTVDDHLQPDGHGSYTAPGNHYFEGEWSLGLRHGFGFNVQPGKDIQVGTWLNGRYKGEQLHFSAERIYGIDIARYQHESGRKRFRINWKALRITHLGKHNQQHATGETAYPVSFIYIKATQGVTVTNRYFAGDYAQARRHGYRVGAYHFYSTTTDARAQAAHFLKVARFSSGDFPPVLDVEPSDAQIKAMGGGEKLLSEMHTWLKVVEQQVGIKPILYLNQGFVNKYLHNAPDLKRNYLIWIARYSEYMPDIRLCWWQLSQTGKVSGIHGDVDINVFNGYRDKWEEYLSEGLIP